MDYIRTTTYTAIILLLCTHVSFAEETKPNFKVRLSISADEDIKQKAESYLSRELRSLGDVTIVDSGDEYKICIIVLQHESESGTLLGYSISVVFGELDNYLYYLIDHRLYTGGPERLRSRCEDIILDFDNKYLKEKRKTLSR